MCAAIQQIRSFLLFRPLTQVCLADINEESGKRAQKELSHEFSEDAVMFVKCDVILEDQVQGIHKHSS